jgi:DNA-binding SARP family transcriptional activator
MIRFPVIGGWQIGDIRARIMILLKSCQRWFNRSCVEPLFRSIDMDRLVLSFLGGFGARLESGAPVPVPTKKGQSLLAYLACSPAASHPRDSLAAMFWGDLPQCHTRHSLRQTLFVLRGALAFPAPSLLHGDATCVSLDRDGITVDAVEFERLTEIGTARSLEQAGELYRGDFLAGISGGTPAFEEWLRDERERLRALAIRAYSKLADLQRAAGLTEKAMRTAERALILEPTEESVHRTLMRIHVAVGRPNAALHQYQRCVQILESELGVEPDANTRDLLRQISSSRMSARFVTRRAVRILSGKARRSSARSREGRRRWRPARPAV